MLLAALLQTASSLETNQISINRKKDKLSSVCTKEYYSEIKGMSTDIYRYMDESQNYYAE